MNTRLRWRIVLISALVLLTLASTWLKMKADTGTCGGATTTVPFTDVGGSTFFCQIAAAYFSGLTNGTSTTTYSPRAKVRRDELADAITNTQDSALRRGSKRAALRQFWTTIPRYDSSVGGLGTTTVGSGPRGVESDGTDLWVANVGGTVSRVRGSDGKLLDTWAGASNAGWVVVAMGRVFVTGQTVPGSLYMIDPTSASGMVTEVTGSRVGNGAVGIAFDGSRVWTANLSGSVSIITPGATIPWSVTTTATGFVNPIGILFDGINIWITDEGAEPGKLLKLDQSGAVVQTVRVGSGPQHPTFDGIDIWVPNFDDNSVSVVRAATGEVISTLTGNGLNDPVQAAFDGQRILVTNRGGRSVSLWKATDLTPIGSLSTTAQPTGACSDGVNFWITLSDINTHQLARF